MKTTIEHFTPMGTEKLMETNGGGFAYDVGRVIRFIGMTGFLGSNTAWAITDWQLNAMINNI